MKLLLCHGAFMGDVILATSILPALKRSDPEMKVGFLVGSWAEEVVKDHAEVDWVHLYDHSLYNRHPIPRREKKKREKKMRKEALREIKSIGYDTALHLSSNYAADLLFQADIRRRISHLTAPTPYFFNQLLFWELDHDHIIENHKRMLLALGIEEEHVAHIEPTFDYKASIFPLPFVLPKNFMLIHMGTGEPTREWSCKNWKRLISHLNSYGLPIVFVGKGKRERKNIQEVKKSCSLAIDLCDQLSFRQLVEVVRRASLVIGVESMCGHVTAALHVPGLFIYSGFASISMWRPFSEKCEIVMPNGADSVAPNGDRSLIHTIKVDEVLEKVEKMFKKYKIGFQ